MKIGQFPTTRMRRLRQNPQVRKLVESIEIKPKHLVLPLFIRHGTGINKPIASMPGHSQISIDQLPTIIQQIQSLGINQLILFGIPAVKDAEGADAISDSGIIQSAIRAIKSIDSKLLIIADLCYCEYTDHGHCGILHQCMNGDYDVDNDQTLEMLAKQAVSHAKAGADIIAPSGMMDGAVQAIRAGLDEAGFTHIPILSYAVKYASAFYGPFREAAEGAPSIGDRKTYQMGFTNRHEAVREAGMDIEEGADMLMVKPAHTYLDIIRDVKDHYPGFPLGAYHTSGEFALLKSAAEKGAINEKQAVMEVLTAIKRAGADFIITYYAKEVAEWLSEC